MESEEIERRLDRFRTALKAAGIKLTPQRLEIFREVASSLEHPNAESVYGAAHARMPSVSRNTVYRNLWTFGELGLVSSLEMGRSNADF